MASLGMGSAMEFDADAVGLIPEDITGNYALGFLNNRGEFVPKYVGRSDDDLRGRLMDHLDPNDPQYGYTYFVYGFATGVKDAYETECRNYHDFQPQLVNKIHPRKPDDMTDLKCPVPGCMQ